ncbi:MAG: diguanylate cyclase [Candidatus Bipolaricaulota bacterium]|nr:diguanylate cyclase [Candidatus Bipolaricaulota bacterium]
MIRQILNDVAEAVIERSPYRRVVVSLYEQPIEPSPDSESRVIEYVAKGLKQEEEKKILLFLEGGGVIRGGKFDPAFRLGDSYYIPARKTPRSIFPWISSRRHFINPRGWQADDLLLIPLYHKGKIIGQISVDDPCNGARPSQGQIRELEKLAFVAAIALDEARHRERLDEQHRLFQFLTESTVAGVIVIQDDRFRYVNDRALELFGYPREEFMALRPWWQLFHPDERKMFSGNGDRSLPLEVEVRGIHSDGHALWLKIEGQEMDFQGEAALLLNLLDVTDRVQTEELLKEKALRDPLTGLFNRLYFDETIHKELERSRRYQRPFTFTMTDLAGFKRINDQFGHQEGDRVLCDVARLIQDQLRESDWIVRYGGDEFLIVLPETGTRVEALAQRLRTAVEQWSASRFEDLSLSIHVGWATWSPGNDLSIPQLLRLADADMYKEKKQR